MKIHFFHNHEIDKDAWDRTIRESLSPLIYAESVYLDHMCPDWGALIDEDKRYVMPLPLKKKMGIVYSFQPPFVQQLGIFSPAPLTADSIRLFLVSAMESVKLADLYLNYTNGYDGVKERCNYILRLNRTFDEISAGFRNDLLPGQAFETLHVEDASISEVVGLYKKHVLPRVRRLSLEMVDRFEQLAQHYEDEGRVVGRKVISANNDMFSAALFLRDDHRIYYMLSANTPEGRKARSNAFLLHQTIKTYSGKPLVFDFEGSELPGVRFFFEKFSPVRQPYFHFTDDRLGAFQKVGRKIWTMFKHR